MRPAGIDTFISSFSPKMTKNYMLKGDRSKSELQKVLKTWIHENRKSTAVEDGAQSSKVHVLSNVTSLQ